jgi:hypothetical protein
VISLTRLELVNDLPLETPFWEFLHVADGSHVCALCETAIVAISERGVVQWRIDTDLISDARVHDDVIEVRLFDGSFVRINALTGAVQRDDQADRVAQDRPGPDAT